MQVKLLHDLVEELAGVDTGRIVEILFGKKDVNEFLIARKMELTINQVRNILYKLSADGLVSFIRKKDKRKGWYIYYWTLKTEKCLEKLERSLVSKIEGLNGILESRGIKRFYVCKSCDIEVNEEKALEHGFSCEECAEVYKLADNSGPIREAKMKIARVEKNLKLIRGELEIIREKDRKKRMKVEKKATKVEGERKALMKVARAVARKKISRGDKKRKTGSGKKGLRKKVRVKKKIVAKKMKKAIKKVKKIGFAGKLKRRFRRKK